MQFLNSLFQQFSPNKKQNHTPITYTCFRSRNFMKLDGLNESQETANTDS